MPGTTQEKKHRPALPCCHALDVHATPPDVVDQNHNALAVLCKEVGGEGWVLVYSLSMVTGGVRTVQVSVHFFGTVLPIGLEPYINRAIVFSSTLSQFKHGPGGREMLYTFGIHSRQRGARSCAAILYTEHLGCSEGQPACCSCATGAVNQLRRLLHPQESARRSSRPCLLVSAHA